MIPRRGPPPRRTHSTDSRHVTSKELTAITSTSIAHSIPPLSDLSSQGHNPHRIHSKQYSVCVYVSDNHSRFIHDFRPLRCLPEFQRKVAFNLQWFRSLRFGELECSNCSRQGGLQGSVETAPIMLNPGFACKRTISFSPCRFTPGIWAQSAP
jgi:hypothetical protein